MPIRPISTSLPVTQFEDPVSAPTEGMLNATATLAALGPRLAEIKAQKGQQQFENDRQVAEMGVDPGHGGIWSQVAGKVSSQQQAAAGDRRQRMDLEGRKTEAALAAHNAAISAHQAAEAHQKAEESRAKLRMVGDAAKGIWSMFGGHDKQGTPRATGMQKTDDGFFRVDEKGITHRWDKNGNPVTPGTAPLQPERKLDPDEASTGFRNPKPGWLWNSNITSDRDFNASQDASLAAPPYQPTVNGVPAGPPNAPTVHPGIFSAQPSGEQPAAAAQAPVDMLNSSGGQPDPHAAQALGGLGINDPAAISDLTSGDTPARAARIRSLAPADRLKVIGALQQLGHQ